MIFLVFGFWLLSPLEAPKWVHDKDCDLFWIRTWSSIGSGLAFLRDSSCHVTLDWTHQALLWQGPHGIQGGARLRSNWWRVDFGRNEKLQIRSDRKLTEVLSVVSLRVESSWPSHHRTSHTLTVILPPTLLLVPSPYISFTFGHDSNIWLEIEFYYPEWYLTKEGTKMRKKLYFIFQLTGAFEEPCVEWRTE